MMENLTDKELKKIASIVKGRGYLVWNNYYGFSIIEKDMFTQMVRDYNNIVDTHYNKLLDNIDEGIKFLEKCRKEIKKCKIINLKKEQPK